MGEKKEQTIVKNTRRAEVCPGTFKAGFMETVILEQGCGEGETVEWVGGRAIASGLSIWVVCLQ